MTEENIQNNEESLEQDVNEEENESNNEEFSLLDEENPDTKEVEMEEGVKPEDLPDELWDEENGTIKTNELYNSWKKAEDRVKGLRTKLARGEGNPPKSVEEYKLEFSDEDNEVLSSVITEGDPLLEKLKEVCFNNKISNIGYQSIVKDMGLFLSEKASDVAEGKHLTEEQREELTRQEYKKIGDNAPAVIRAVTEWGRGLNAQGVLSEDDIKTLTKFGATGDGVRVLNIIRQLTGDKEIPMQAQVGDGLPSDAEIYNMIGSKKYQDGDAAYIAKVDALLQKRVEAGRPERLQV